MFRPWGWISVMSGISVLIKGTSRSFPPREQTSATQKGVSLEPDPPGTLISDFPVSRTVGGTPMFVV